ncbi:hypothetical protein AAVH_12058 [Aphelenchoides avenae]|nr:hypothetical protein AAVH_12057 [Aphelenchus avenae]KAH7720525.1 hypothetical protein AAVH_12058 [Aphelenchus avenae]
MNDVQSGKTIDLNGRITTSGTGSGTLGRSGTGGAQGQQFTNNIYGYDYRSNPDMKYTVNGNEAQYQPPQYSRYEPPPGSPFGRKRRQASYQPYGGRSSFAGTAYQNQDIPFQRDNSVMQQPLFYSPPMMDKSFPSAPRSNWQFYDPGMNLTAMYYPYRTTVEEHPIG